MATGTILIADPNEDFREALTAVFSRDFQVRCCGRGDEAAALLEESKPDLLILDLELPGLDGISLLKQLSDRPPVLVVTYLITPVTYHLLLELDIAYAIRKPCAMQKVLDRALDVMRVSFRPREPLHLHRWLAGLGLSSGRRGFRHLLTGLPLLAENRNQLLSKELYETIAVLDNSSAGAVEKAIRDVIQDGWAWGDRREWERCFPGMRRCPSNREFLFRIADLLKERQLCG